MKPINCRWDCGGKTSNRSGICDPCWQDRNRIRSERKVTEASKPRSEAQRDALRKLNPTKLAKLAKDLPQSGG